MKLDNLNGPSQTELLGRLKALRTPDTEQSVTEEPEAVDVSEDTEPDEPEQEVEATQEEDAVESEELSEVEEEAVEADDGDEETLYLELDGKEFTLDEVKEWQQGNLRQADYTRKTQELADSRKALEGEQDKAKELQKSLTALTAELQAQIETDDSDINWDELREDDPSEYLRLKERQEKKKKALAEAKGQTSQLSDQEQQATIAEEQQKLFESAGWRGEDGQTNKQYDDDMALIQGYLKDSGYQDQDVQGILSHKHWLTILDAARFKAQSAKGSALSKKAKKVPLVTRPATQAKSNLDRQIQAAQKRFKQSGDLKDAMALRKLKRQKGN